MRKRRRSPISSINVVPYLDVMLVLLVIFMITAPLFNQGAVDLPQVGDKPPPAQKEGALEIIYHPHGGDRPYQLYDHDNDTETARLDAGELLQELEAEIKTLGRAAPIVISADSELQYGDITELLGMLYDHDWGDNEPTIALNVKSRSQ